MLCPQSVTLATIDFQEPPPHPSKHVQHPQEATRLSAGLCGIRLPHMATSAALSAPLRSPGLVQCQAPLSGCLPSKHVQHIKRPKHLSAGSHGAVLALGDAKHPWLNLSGFWSWVAWRSAYLTRLGSINNRIYVMLNWLTTILFGRDMSRWG